MALLHAPERGAAELTPGQRSTKATHWARLFVLLPALVAVGLAAGWLVDPGGQHQGLIQYGDDVVRAHVLAHSSVGLQHLMKPVLWLGAPHVVPFVAVGIALVLLALGRRWQALVPLVAVAGTDAMVGFLKLAVARPGPGELASTGLAFPSGHTSGITALVVPLAVVAWTTRRWWWPAVVAAALVALVGVALLVLDAHWFSDIVAGAALTGTWCTAVAAWIPGPRSSAAGSPSLHRRG